MCTSIVSNISGTVIGWNLDLLMMDHKVVTEKDKVYIAVNDKTEGWLPLFGANSRGDFVTMPTCWPYDKRSDPVTENENNIIMLDIDLLLGKKTLDGIKAICENNAVRSVPGVTFQSQLSDKYGNVLQIVPGQGTRYLNKPRYSVMTNFSPFKEYSETHPWMGYDRYCTAVKHLEQCKTFGVPECFELLRMTAQTVCPTVVSTVFDINELTVYWCEGQEWGKISKHKLV